MLKSLKIINYALIENLEIDFHRGLNVITGETGAGKSIILGAIGLILGNRFESSALIDQSRKVIVEGSFELDKKKYLDFFIANDLDFDIHSIIRREILPSGKSRAFINDTPVNLNKLTEFSENLVDIHSQHQNTQLNNPSFQLALLDNFAHNRALLQSYITDYKEYLGIDKELLKLRKIESQSKKDIDYFQFQLDELQRAGLQINEQDSLEEELNMLENAEHIKSTLFHIHQSLTNEETGVLEKLNMLENDFGKIQNFNTDFKSLLNRIESVNIELNDIDKQVENLSEIIETDDEKLNLISERLSLINQLLSKHQVRGISELMEIQEKLQQKLENIESLESRIEKLAVKKEKLSELVFDQAIKLSDKRKKVIPEVEKEMVILLKQLGMKNASVRFELETLIDDSININGKDKLIMLFSSNKGIEPQPISKVASGGELSRLMLSIKYLLAGNDLLPTIIFDEIDLGISGEIAIMVGKILKKLAQKHQIISITHLPQVAAMGQHHYYVFKEVKNDRSLTLLKEIENEERVHEIAKMIGGDDASQSAIENAKELLSNFA